ncbi:MAG TPA: response regulator [Steroidobacteraceae bacterium]|nr:response regulator [Steroidobacteraceae bacterium]
MSAKRALVVDDSKSARLFLSRILERHEIAVDAAESAEQAIDYLTRTKPDVIFMDHMMPGMDGFQAVQSIKNNPRTSSIPILMYTSQEGDLYLGQARALGAEGVLPKQIKQADVTRMLYQLRLVADRRGEERIEFTPIAPGADLMPANESAIIVTPPPAVDVPTLSGTGEPVAAAAPADAASPSADVANLLPQLSLEIRAALDTSLQKEIAALKGYLGTTLSAQAERLSGDLAVLLPAPRSPDVDMPTLVPERRPWGAISGWTLAVIALAFGGFMYWSWWLQGNEVAVLRSDLSAAVAEAEALRARPEVVSDAPALVPETFVSTDGSTPAVVATPPAVDATLAPEAAAAAPATASAPGASAPTSALPTPAPAAPGPVTHAPATTPVAAAPATDRAQ